MSCERALQGDLVDRYLRGDLAETETEAFEIHVLECRDCFEVLDAGRLAREALQGAVSASAGSVTRRPWRLATWPLAAGLAALTLGWIMTARLPPGGETPAPPKGGAPSASTERPSPPTSLGPRAAELTELARFEPPSYVPLTLRGGGAEEWHGFDRAMAHYARREYGRAVILLREAVRERPDSAEAWFFLGISELLADSPSEAVASLGRAVELGRPPHSQAARYFTAKAFLMRGDVEGARRELRVAAEIGGAYASEARGMLARLDKLDGAS